jgi:hypothetical protein
MFVEYCDCCVEVRKFNPKFGDRFVYIHFLLDEPLGKSRADRMALSRVS